MLLDVGPPMLWVKPGYNAFLTILVIGHPHGGYEGNPDGIRQMTWHCAKIIWWLMLGAIPLALRDIAQSFRSQIGCPPGDCYLPGAYLVTSIEVIEIAMFVFVWPVCLWYLVGNAGLIIRHIRGS